MQTVNFSFTSWDDHWWSFWLYTVLENSKIQGKYVFYWEWSKRGSREARSEYVYRSEANVNVAPLSRYGLEVWKFGMVTSDQFFRQQHQVFRQRDESVKRVHRRGEESNPRYGRKYSIGFRRSTNWATTSRYWKWSNLEFLNSTCTLFASTNDFLRRPQW